MTEKLQQEYENENVYRLLTNESTWNGKKNLFLLRPVTLHFSIA